MTHAGASYVDLHEERGRRFLLLLLLVCVWVLVGFFWLNKNLFKLEEKVMQGQDFAYEFQLDNMYWESFQG